MVEAGDQVVDRGLGIQPPAMSMAVSRSLSEMSATGSMRQHRSGTITVEPSRTGPPHAHRYSVAIDAAAYLTFTRDEWASLRAATPMTLSEADIADLRGINVALTRGEVEQVYLPLTRLHPNAELARRGLLDRKGFPESYDRSRLLAFVEQVKGGAPEVSAPVYSHITYDIVPGRRQTVSRPDIVVVEGLNVLQGHAGGPAVSDHFDFSIFIDAEVADIAYWYVERFHTFRRTAFRDRASYFRHYAELSDADAEVEARRLWRTINEVNLREHILPTRARASLVLTKRRDHAVTQVRLRRG